MAEDQFESVDPLARVSKENGLVLFAEVPDLVTSDAEDLLLDNPLPENPLLDDKADDRRFEEPDELFEPDGFDKNHDPVRLYLREMGSVPLLSREGEIAIARRIERGQSKTRRTLSRCPVIVQEMVKFGEELRAGQREARETLLFNDPLPTDETYAVGAQAAIAACERAGKTAA